MKNFFKDICKFIRNFSYDLTSIITCINHFYWFYLVIHPQVWYTDNVYYFKNRRDTTNTQNVTSCNENVSGHEERWLKHLIISNHCSYLPSISFRSPLKCQYPCSWCDDGVRMDKILITLNGLANVNSIQINWGVS